MKIWIWNKIWKEEKGATMAELIAGLAVMVIVLGFGGSLLIWTGNAFARTLDQSVTLRKLELAGDYICRQITDAKSMEISHSRITQASYTHVLRFGSDGLVALDGNPILDPEGKIFYYVNVIDPDVNQNSPLFAFVLTACNEKNETLYSDESVVKLVNLEAMQKDRDSLEVFVATSSNAVIELESMDSRDRDIYLHYSSYKENVRQ